MNNYLFLVSQNYGFPILRPLQDAIRARGDRVAWFFDNPACRIYLRGNEIELGTVEEVFDFDPVAVFACDEHMYHFFPGVKVQLFRGFDVEKPRGRSDHYRISGMFDLYCVNDTSAMPAFRKLAQHYRSFRVVETGWPKLDSFFGSDGKLPVVHNDLPVILYSSTFTKWITSTPYLYDEIERLVTEREWRWIITFHPEMATDVMERYRKLARYTNVAFYDGDDNVAILKKADVMLCDTSSIIYEFMYLDRPVVTFRNAVPGDCIIDINDPALLEGALETALQRPKQLMKSIRAKMDEIHPQRDGHSSQRVLHAVDEFIASDRSGLRKKRPGLLCRYKARRRLGYFKRDKHKSL